MPWVRRADLGALSGGGGGGGTASGV